MTVGPLCFLHVPKCGGQSVERALEAAVPQGSVAPRGADLEGCRAVSNLASFEDVEEWVRALIAIRDEDVDELRDYRFVTGHYTLPTLLRLTPPERIVTVLREPRVRLVSLYLFFRMPDMHEVWGNYCGGLLDSASRPLEEFLTDPAIARATDNQVCRMVLSGDPRIPDDGFVADGNVESIAADTVQQLDRLGLVAILESGDSMWRDMSRALGVELEPRRVNESSTPTASAGAAPIPAFDSAAVFDGLERRGAADRIVYETLVARTHGGPQAARRRADHALAEQLARFDRVRAAATTEPPRTPLAAAYDQGDT
jgi:hypothetical protein